LSTEDNANQTEFSIRDRKAQSKRQKAVEMNCFIHLGILNLENIRFSTMNTTTVSIPGYRISEELYNGSRTLVYRGYRKTDELPVVIKLLKNPYPSFSELLWFRNQYTIVDYRADFYSLGVTFYELLTGKLPFQSSEPMELVHCHLAKLPPLLREVKSEEIPQVLSDIVMKLMAKNAEDRYQSALGLKFDLENCLSQLQETGEIKSFPIAQRDVCVGVARRRHRFIIQGKLYGRETEVETLLQAFERVSLGATEMMLVAGFSGIGKTVVINEIHKPIVRQRGYFIKGKFDQFQLNIPLSALVQTFRDLIGQLLTESDSQIQQWKIVQNRMLSGAIKSGIYEYSC
jgi:serine/threonine protein kinase